MVELPLVYGFLTFNEYWILAHATHNTLMFGYVVV